MTPDQAFLLESHSDAVIFSSTDRRLRIGFVTDDIARITFTGMTPFRNQPSRIVVERNFTPCVIEEQAEKFFVSTASLTIEVDKITAALRFIDRNGKVLMQEPSRGGKSLTPKSLERHVFDRGSEILGAQNVDGARASAMALRKMFDREAFEAKLEFAFQEHEALFGLGSHEEGYCNLRGRSRYLYQQNMKAVVPHLVSTRGYSVLMDCGSLMSFHDDTLGSYWWADAVNELDYYVIAGENFDTILRRYRYLTGPTPMLPKWAFGFFQSKERYVNAQEILDIAIEYRRRQIPLDAIVLDWKSWPNGSGWGQKSFDPVRFPNPASFIEQLHSLGIKLMVSIWPIMTGDCENQIELRSRGLMLGNQSTYDAFQEEARNVYWEQANRGLFVHGVDAWWCDCTEPFEADWSGAVKPEPDLRLTINTQASKTYLDPAEINEYSLLHSQGIYEGQRRTTEAKRVVNLTRSSYAGQHRYSTISWNGDICATWETLAHCIAEGINFCATGEAYWTVDAGGFFIQNDPSLWFWSGDYNAGCRGLTPMDALAPDPNDTGCTDLGFWELYTRWMQYAAFLPIFRSHGTDAPREIWRFGEPGSPFYDAIAGSIYLRYRLLPYIYSLAAEVTRIGAPMLRGIALSFPKDPQTHHLTDQFLFGPSLLVCPVTHPMYYDRNSRKLTGIVCIRNVYLPAHTDWYDFFTGQLYDGGKSFDAAAPLETIPVFVKSGSIIPMTQPMQYVDELHNSELLLHVYAGSNASFSLYEDEGDGYAYEQGQSATVLIEWDNAHNTLKLHERIGSFPGLCESRPIRAIVHSRFGKQTRSFLYDGQPCHIIFHPDEESN